MKTRLSGMTIRSVVLAILLASGLYVSLPLASPAGEAFEPANLWRAAAWATADPPSPRKPWVLREREIAVDQQLLEILKDASARPHPRVTVEFFDGSRHELDITSTVSRFNDTAVIRGSFKPPSRGDFTLVASGRLLIGSLHAGDHFYRTEHTGNGRIKLFEVDPRKMPPE